MVKLDVREMPMVWADGIKRIKKLHYREYEEVEDKHEHISYFSVISQY